MQRVGESKESRKEWMGADGFVRETESRSEHRCASANPVAGRACFAKQTALQPDRVGNLSAVDVCHLSVGILERACG